MNKTRTFRAAVCTLLSFILAVCLVLLSVLAVVKLTVLTPSFLVGSLEKSGYGTELRSELKNKLISYGNACNIGDDFFNKFFDETLTEEYILNDVSEYVIQMYSSSSPKVETEQLSSALKTALLSYAVERGYENDATLDEDLNVIVGEIDEIYSGYIAIPAASTINSVVSRFAGLINLALPVSAVFTLFVALVIFLSFRKKSNPVRYFIYASSAAFLMTTVLPLCVKLMGIIDKVNIVSKSIYSLVVTYANSVLNAFFICSAVLAVITVGLIVLYVTLKNNEE